jgi:hypothetical protein
MKIIFYHEATDPRGPRLQYRGFTITLRHTCTTLGRTSVDEWSAWRRDFWHHATFTTDINAPGGFRTPNPIKRAVAELRLRPRDYWDRQMANSEWNFILIIRNFRCFLYSIRLIKTAIWKSWHYIGISSIFVADRIIIFSELPCCASCLIIERSRSWTLCKLDAIIVICVVVMVHLRSDMTFGLT